MTWVTPEAALERFCLRFSFGGRLLALLQAHVSLFPLFSCFGSFVGTLKGFCLNKLAFFW